MSLAEMIANAVSNADTFREASRIRNPGVLRSLLGPAWRGFVQRAQREGDTVLLAKGDVCFSWGYERQRADFLKLYEAAKQSQWDAQTRLDWSITVDPGDPERALLSDEWNPIKDLPVWSRMNAAEQQEQARSFMAWIVSQFLHGEQGALFAATQVTQAVPWFEGKLYGATQVMDEARHLEVFLRYVDTKLEKRYQIDDNLYVIIDALMSDSRFDVKFLGMQIMIEGLALGAFGFFRRVTKEPLLRELLKYVITDEARHVHYGVLALREHTKALSDKEIREREDWAFEVALLLRNRFLLHEFHDEFHGHSMTRREWDAFVLSSPMMEHFRKTMFERIVPNLKRIGLLSERMRPHYAAIGLLDYEGGKAATELSASDLLELA